MVQTSNWTGYIRQIIKFAVLLLCLFIQVIPVIRSGINSSYGLGFWNATGHDHIWHLSLINHITPGQKIDIPVYSGQSLTNYHPFFNIIIATIAKITTINSSILLFQVFPVVSACLLIYSSYLLGGIYLACLNSFATSFGWIITFLRSGSFGGESLFWSMQSASTQINPPYALSLLYITTLLLVLPKKPTKLDIPKIIIVTLLLLAGPLTKAYSIVPLFLIVISYSYYCYQNRLYQPLIVSTVVIILSVGLFYYLNPTSGSVIQYSPFWFVRSLAESTDRLYIPVFANIMNLPSIDGIYSLTKVVTIYLLTTTIFLVGNYGYRFLSLHYLAKETGWQKTASLAIIPLCTVIPLIFIQSGTPWNTIQFLYYSLFFSNIYLAKYLQKHRVIAIIVLLSSLLGNLDSLKNSLGSPPPAHISNTEVQALEYLKQRKNGTVLTYPYEPTFKSDLVTPIPLYAYESTAYVAAYSHKKTFVDDYMNLSNSGYPYKSRLQESVTFFKQNNIHQDRGFLLNNQIDYIYLTGKQKEQVKLNEVGLYLIKIFENESSTIYSVQR